MDRPRIKEVTSEDPDFSDMCAKVEKSQNPLQIKLFLQSQVAFYLSLEIQSRLGLQQESMRDLIARENPYDKFIYPILSPAFKKWFDKAFPQATPLDPVQVQAFVADYNAQPENVLAKMADELGYADVEACLQGLTQRFQSRTLPGQSPELDELNREVQAVMEKTTLTVPPSSGMILTQQGLDDESGRLPSVEKPAA